MATIGGNPVTDAQIQAWADEAEAGYDVDVLRKRGRKPKGHGPARDVAVRLDGTLLDAIDERAAHDHVSKARQQYRRLLE
ncbi:MAG: CopG family transcriptional regulator [Actinomycetia bacterium]|nr:CopG family transcriptional regulator [Actinomycetes bacterium]